MKRTIAFMLIALTIPLSAQQTTEVFDLRSAIAREAKRFAENTSSKSNEENQSAAPASSDWSRVRGLPSSTRVTVTVHGVQYSSRYFVTADEGELTVLNFPSLPSDVKRALWRLTLSQPSYFASDQPQVHVDGNVRVDALGVFQNGQKVITLDRLVEKLSRHEVIEITGSSGTGGFMNNFGGLIVIGAVLAGSIGGGMFAYRQFGRYKPLGAAIGGYAGLGAGVAAGFGIVALGGGFRDAVIYRAP